MYIVKANAYSGVECKSIHESMSDAQAAFKKLMERTNRNVRIYGYFNSSQFPELLQEWTAARNVIIKF